jgi:predicted nucleic acid-binding protein
MRVFLDTNILLDGLLKREPFVKESTDYIILSESVGVKMWIAWHGLATAYYLLKKGRSEEETLMELDRILSWARVAAVGDAHAREARQLGFSDFEDALQAVSAEAPEARWIITRNTRDFSASRVRAITPTDYLRLFRDQIFKP